MDFLKGSGQALAMLAGVHRKIELLMFADGSAGIACDGSMHSIWETNEVEDCFRAFLHKVAAGHAAMEKLTVFDQETELRQCETAYPVNFILSKRWPLN